MEISDDLIKKLVDKIEDGIIQNGIDIDDYEEIMSKVLCEISNRYSDIKFKRIFNTNEKA
jgi:hypothetical protein